MPSVVQICNMALTHIGAEALVASIDPPDGSVEAGYCATFYSVARQEALELGTFKWGVTRVALALASTNPSTTWAYAYARPSNCLDPLRVLPTSLLEVDAWPADRRPELVPTNAAYSERAGAEFEIEGDLILTNEPDAVLVYKVDVTDTTKFSASFASALSMLLASYIASPIIKGEQGARVGLTWRQAAVSAISSASAMDANASQETSEFIPSSVRARA